jgi:RNA polymerase sigma-70 factor (ECF subfamily)
MAQRLALRRAMDELPVDQRAALALCLGQDFTHQEAAEVLNLPLGTVKSHINRGRARLQAALGVPAEQGQ